MDAPGADVDPVADAVRRRLGPLVLRVRNGHLTPQDEVRGQADVGVRAVVGVSGGQRDEGVSMGREEAGPL